MSPNDAVRSAGHLLGRAVYVRSLATIAQRHQNRYATSAIFADPAVIDQASLDRDDFLKDVVQRGENCRSGQSDPAWARRQAASFEMRDD